MGVEISVRRVEASPTAVVAASTTWSEFPRVWGPMLDAVWSFLRGGAPAGLYDGGHNVMLYRDGVADVEVGVQVTRAFDAAGQVRSSTLPGGLVATATHTGPVAGIGRTHQAIGDWIVANGYQASGPRWEVYGDPDPTSGEFTVEVFWALQDR